MAVDYEDMGPVIDWMNNAKGLEPWDGKSQPKVDPGEYLFEIVKTRIKESNKPNDKPSLGLQLQVISDGPMNGRHVWAWYKLVSATENEFAYKRFLSIQRAVGLPENEPFRADQFLGRQIQATVFIDEYEVQGAKKEATKVAGEKSYQVPAARRTPAPVTRR